MKSILVSALLLAAAGSVQAQTYTYSGSTTTYTALTGATTLLNGSWDDSIVTGVPIGFPFYYMGYTYNAVNVDTWGVLEFDQNIQYNFNGLTADYVSRNGTIVSYKTVGISPNREFIAEFSNVGFFYDTSGSARCNFQLVLLENGNKLETRVGASNGVLPAFFDDLGPNVGVTDLNFATSTINYALLLDGPPANPTAQTLSGPFIVPALDAFPVSGQVYTFQPASTNSIEENVLQALHSGPNPATDYFAISNPEQLELSVSLFSGEGRLIQRREQENSEMIRIELADLPPGLYLVELTNAQGMRTVKRVVKN